MNQVSNLKKIQHLWFCGEYRFRSWFHQGLFSHSALEAHWKFSFICRWQFPHHPVQKFFTEISIFYRLLHCVLRSQVLILISPQFHSRNKEHTQTQLTLLELKIFYVIKKQQNQFIEENWWPLSKKPITSLSNLRVRHYSRLKPSPENITMYKDNVFISLQASPVLTDCLVGSPRSETACKLTVWSGLNILLFITFERNVSCQNTCLAVRWS